jgi:hypothetical protein
MTGVPALQSFDSIAPVMSGVPALTGTLIAASIGGLSTSDSGGSGFAGTSLTVGKNPGGAGDSPVWSGSSITGIDLSGLTDTSHYLRFYFTLKDNAGNAAYYSVELKPNIVGPAAFTDFTLSGPSLIQTTITPCSIDGIFVSDSGGSGLAGTSMAVTRSPGGAGGTPLWNGNSITGIDLSGLTTTAHYLRFDFTLRDTAGNTAVYRVQVSPNKANPAALADYTLTGPTLQGTPTITRSGPADPHGEAASGSAFFNQGIWNILGFSAAEWDFSRVVSVGHPRLAWEQ